MQRYEWRSADLQELVEAAVTPLLGLEEVSHRFSAAGPQALVQEQTAMSLSLALHELGSNARKYGGFSTESGRVDVSGGLIDTDIVHLTWRETTDFPITPPQREGFGTKVITEAFRRTAGGSAELVFDSTGLICRLEFPISR